MSSFSMQKAGPCNCSFIELCLKHLSDPDLQAHSALTITAFGLTTDQKTYRGKPPRRIGTINDFMGLPQRVKNHHSQN